MPVNRKGPVLDRVLAKVEVDDTTGCWIFTGRRSPWGYGRVGVDGRSKVTHRVTYEALVGPVPEGLQLDHLCNNPPCCNPEHLEPVTASENMRRARQRRPVPLKPIEHGTRSGYRSHRQRGEEACRDCKAAAARHVRETRERVLARRAS